MGCPLKVWLEDSGPQGHSCCGSYRIVQPQSRVFRNVCRGLLLKQICEAKDLDPDKVIYIECNPDTHSRLSFFQEEYFRVTFENKDGELLNPVYEKLTDTQIKELIFHEE